MQEEKKRKSGPLAILKHLLSEALEHADECTDDEIDSIVAEIETKRRKYVRQDDYVNTDKAMKFLGVKSRGRFFSLMREHGIENRKMNNQPIGFRKEEIESLYMEIHGKEKFF